MSSLNFAFSKDLDTLYTLLDYTGDVYFKKTTLQTSKFTISSSIMVTVPLAAYKPWVLLWFIYRTVPEVVPDHNSSQSKILDWCNHSLKRQLDLRKYQHEKQMSCCTSIIPLTSWMKSKTNRGGFCVSGICGSSGSQTVLIVSQKSNNRRLTEPY